MVAKNKPILMEIYDGVEDRAGYCKEDVEGLVENLLDIIDAVRSMRELHPAQEGIISKTEKWLNEKQENSKEESHGKN